MVLKTHHVLLAQFNKQLALDARVNQFADGTATSADRETYGLLNVYAAIKELTEALDELSWKPWASAEFFNRKAYLGELADVQLFLDNLKLMALQPGESELDSVYNLSTEFDEIVTEKIENALRRSREGYDGVTDKCSVCKRDKTAAQMMLGQLLCPCGATWELSDDD